MKTPKAYLYSRVSFTGQLDGSGIDRQDERGLAYYNREITPTGIPLDDTVRSDKGRSAYKGRHLKEDGALRKILDEIATGTIAPGSIVIVENLDRISRQGPKLARKVLEKITDFDVEIHILNINQKLRRNWENLPEHSIIVDIELNRAWKESSYKAERIKAGWKHALANAATEVVTENVPAWLEVVDGKIVEKPEMAATVREAFRLSALGMGVRNIARTLNGRLENLSLSWLLKLLKSRTVLGEFSSEGFEPVLNYYRPILSQSEFDATQAALQAKRIRSDGKIKSVGGGRFSARADNLFSRLVWDKDVNRKMYFQKCPRGVYLQTAVGLEPKPNRIRYADFEAAMLDFLAHALDWKAVAGATESEEAKAAAKELDVVLGECDRTRRLADRLKAAMDDPDASLAILSKQLEKAETKLAELTEKKTVLTTKRESARAKCDALYTPEALLSLIGAPDSKDLRLRLKAEIGKRISRIEFDFSGKLFPELVMVNVQFVNSAFLVGAFGFRR